MLIKDENSTSWRLKDNFFPLSTHVRHIEVIVHNSFDTWNFTPEQSDIRTFIFTTIASFSKIITKKDSNSIMDYQCIVIYTIVRIAPLYPPQANSNMPSSSSNKREQSNRCSGCLDWIKLQIKRWLWWILVRAFLRAFKAHK